MALADTASLIVNLNLRGNFGSQLSRASRSLNTFDTRLDRTESRAFRVGQHIGTGIKNLGRLAVAGAAAVGTIAVASLKLAGEFEAQLNTINTIARETPAGLSKIGDQIRQIARDTGTPLEELTQGYYDLLSAGIKAADAQGVLAASNRLAIGGLATTAETVDLLTTAINTYGVKASKASQIADIFAKAIERGKVTAAGLAGAFSDIGPIAAASGISLSEVAAGFARLTASGVPAGEAATQMRSAIVALTRTTKPLEALQKATGRNYLKIAGKKGLVVALEQLRKDAAKAGVPLIDLLGRVEGLNFTLATTGPNLKLYNADLAAMGNAAGTAAGQMAEREKGLNFQLARLRALASDAGITIGNKLLPKIVPIFERINAAIEDNQPAIEAFGEAIAGLFSKENIQAGVQTLKDLGPILVSAAQATGAAIAIAVRAFQTLPREVQALAAGAFGLNKLTNGLVTTLAGGLFSQFFARGSSPANPMWVATVGAGVGGPPVPVPGGPPGGGAPSGLPFTPGASVIISMADLNQALDIFHRKLSASVNGPIKELQSRLHAVTPPPANQPRNLPPGHDLKLTQDQLAAIKERTGQTTAAITALDPKFSQIYGGLDQLGPDLDMVSGTVSGAVDRGAIATQSAIRTAEDGAASRVVGATHGAASSIVAAIYAARPIVNVTSVTKTTTITNRYGPPNGSYGQTSGH